MYNVHKYYINNNTAIFRYRKIANIMPTINVFFSIGELIKLYCFETTLIGSSVVHRMDIYSVELYTYYRQSKFLNDCVSGF